MISSKEDVLYYCKELNVRFIYLQLTDILGVLKSITIPVSQLSKALDNQLMFDGSSIEGYVRIEESDMYLRPDPTSFSIFPWRSKEEGMEARLICDVYNPDGTPAQGCPRSALKKVVKEASEMGFQYKVGPEMEFFLFHTDDKGAPTLHTQDRASYFDLSPVDRGENARRDMVITLEDMGFEIEAAHHEVAPGQHEIGFKYTDPVKTGDNILTCKHVVRVMAQKHGLHASFMPKPLSGIAGSGMHCHQSLFMGDQNIFYDSQTPSQLSDIALQFLAGILHHAKAITAITNPTVNSYKRLVSGFEAPVYIAWSEHNRSPLLRVPAKRGISTRLELRSPDPTCNPYLAMAVMLKAGLDGINKKMVPPDPVEQNIYELDNRERIKLGIDSLPNNLKEALDELDKDEVIQDALGEHIYHRFREAKLKEWDCYRLQVHQWEIDRYLTMF